jgi:hypothetical protein
MCVHWWLSELEWVSCTANLCVHTIVNAWLMQPREGIHLEHTKGGNVEFGGFVHSDKDKVGAYASTLVLCLVSSSFWFWTSLALLIQASTAHISCEVAGGKVPCEPSA